MIGVDTNVIVRYLTQDDPQQSATATRFLENVLSAENPGHVPLVVLAEVAWVLTSLYTVDRAGLVTILSGLLTTVQLHVESAELVWRALRRFERSKADFSDALILECATEAGCSRAVTFDRQAAATSGFELLT